ncbi:hypothetical protein V5O48_009766 [Marasmius crinis-equi]|uniref:Uncharacterized protein n=1 Tax=Marasmius crinis-equi TaxID=585013 RepID=A0ABR3FAE2_9AGAR
MVGDWQVFDSFPFTLGCQESKLCKVYPSGLKATNHRVPIKLASNGNPDNQSQRNVTLKPETDFKDNMATKE